MPSGDTQAKRRVRTVIFLAPEFSISEVADLFCRLRNRGNFVTTVGVKAGSIDSRLGLKVYPDHTVTSYVDSNSCDEFDELFVTGSETCIRPILTDPRIVRLIRKANEQGKAVYCSDAGKHFLAQLGIDCEMAKRRLWLSQRK